MAAEQDPTGRDPHLPGAKLDAGKPPMSLLLDGFPHALKAVAEVAAFGEKKYTRSGHLSVPNGVDRYTSGLMRHLVDEHIEGKFTEDSRLLHAAHAAWNALARLELTLRDLHTKEPT